MCPIEGRITTIGDAHVNIKSGVVNPEDGRMKFVIEDKNPVISFKAGAETISVTRNKAGNGQVFFLDENLNTRNYSLHKIGDETVEKMDAICLLTPTLFRQIQKGEKLEIKRNGIFTLTIENT